MTNSQSPNQWTAPQWHSDYGDATAELEHLRALALAACSMTPRLAVELMIPEPGLMYIQAKGADGIVLEAYSTSKPEEPNSRIYALFAISGPSDEEEFYADSVDEAIRFFKAQLD
jgi:hypothetical protein